MQAMRKAQIARELGVSKGRVSQYLKMGMPVLSGGQSVDLDAAREWVQQNVDPVRKIGQNPAPRTSRRKQATAPAEGEPLDLAHEKARLTKAQADRAEGENALRTGTLLERSEVVAAWQAVFISVRAKLLSLPTRMSARIAGMSTPAQIQAALTEVIHEALHDLSNTRVVASNPDALPAETVGLPRTKSPRKEKEAAHAER
jgi:phage terminase Nu1 subunit (DNA packaging protein)